MPARNPLLAAPPYPVEQSLKRLGNDLRTARLRRNLTIRDVAEKIGTGPRAVGAAEKGKPSTGIAVYIALLWTYDLLGEFDQVATPENDRVGQALARAGERIRARKKNELDDDF